MFGYAKSRQNAKVLIESGNVLLDGKPIAKPSQDIDESIEHNIQISNRPRFVSRGGEKLDFALNAFNVNVDGTVCIDIGASTGGFTDCLLQRGADRVYAVDSGCGQLDPSLELDERVISIEKYNARLMKAEDFPTLFDLAVMDVSFISQTLLHPGIHEVLKDSGILVSLIKPQFECGRAALNSKGIVKKPSHHEMAIRRVIDSAAIVGFSCIGLVKSPIEGGSGNVEFLAIFKKEPSATGTVSDKLIKSVI